MSQNPGYGSKFNVFDFTTLVDTVPVLKEERFGAVKNGGFATLVRIIPGNLFYTSSKDDSTKCH